jgi:hypothetical protein
MQQGISFTSGCSLNIYYVAVKDWLMSEATPCAAEDLLLLLLLLRSWYAMPRTTALSGCK